MNLEEIKREFGDCNWMRGIHTSYTVDAILWLISRAEILELVEQGKDNKITEDLTDFEKLRFMYGA